MGKRVDYWAKFEEHAIYHIYNRGINGENIFKEEKNYGFFLKRWAELILPFFGVGAYCLMPNHFHFLAWVKPLEPNILKIIGGQNTVRAQKFLDKKITYNTFLEDQFKRLFTSYALAINAQEGRTGSLLQKRFKRVLLDNVWIWQHCLAYVHHNPIHHQFCEKYGMWKYCSYQAYFNDSPTKLAKAPVLKWFAEDSENAMKNFIFYHKEFKKSRGFGDWYLDDE